MNLKQNKLISVFLLITIVIIGMIFVNASSIDDLFAGPGSSLPQSSSGTGNSLVLPVKVTTTVTNITNTAVIVPRENSIMYWIKVLNYGIISGNTYNLPGAQVAANGGNGINNTQGAGGNPPVVAAKASFTFNPKQTADVSYDIKEEVNSVFGMAFFNISEGDFTKYKIVEEGSEAPVAWVNVGENIYRVIITSNPSKKFVAVPTEQGSTLPQIKQFFKITSSSKNGYWDEGDLINLTFFNNGEEINSFSKIVSERVKPLETSTPNLANLLGDGLSIDSVITAKLGPTNGKTLVVGFTPKVNSMFSTDELIIISINVN